MKIKKSLLLLLLSVVLVIITACGSSSNNTSSNANGNTNTSNNESSNNAGEELTGIEPMTIRISTNVPVGHSMGEGAVKVKEVIEERTNGVVTVEIFPDQQLGSLRENTEAVQLGTLEMTTMTVSTIAGGFVDELKVMEYPYLWPTDIDQLWQVVDGPAGQQLLDTMDKAGFKGLGFWGGGFKAFTNNGNPVLAPSDLKGMNVRVIPSETLIAQFEAWDANPIAVDFAELYTALQQGTVDAQENPLETINTMKFYEVQDHLSVLNHGYQFYTLIANKAWFDGLSPEMQEIVKEAELAARAHSRELNIASNEKTLDELKDLGLQIHELNDEQIQAFAELSMPLHDQLSDTQEKKDILAAIKAEIDKLQ